MKGCQYHGYKYITYYSRLLSDEQREAVIRYYYDGYNLDDLYAKQLNEERDSR